MYASGIEALGLHMYPHTPGGSYGCGFSRNLPDIHSSTAVKTVVHPARQ